jgi:signal peptidase II
MKLRWAFLLIFLVIAADQALKIWIKVNHPIGEVTRLFGFDWARLHFIENPGMAWGMMFGGAQWGKAALTIFRLLAIIFGTWYLFKITREKYNKGFIICAALIYAGALGNLIDSMFYGMIFDKGMLYDPVMKDYMPYYGVAKFSSHGYQGFLFGNVVDMLYFPMVRSTFPQWMPLLGGKQFEFFSPIFNIADASISIGVVTLLIFQKRFFRKADEEHHDAVQTDSQISDQAHVM